MVWCTHCKLASNNLSSSLLIIIKVKWVCSQGPRTFILDTLKNLLVFYHLWAIWTLILAVQWISLPCWSSTNKDLFYSLDCWMVVNYHWHVQVTSRPGHFTELYHLHHMADWTKILHIPKHIFTATYTYVCAWKKWLSLPISVSLSLFTHAGDHQASTVPFQNTSITFYSTLGSRAQNHWSEKGWIREETGKGYKMTYIMFIDQ